MNIGKISYVNKKGQVVIPSKYRKELGITEETPLHIVINEAGLLVYPVKNLSFNSRQKNNKSYKQILHDTQGSWAADKSREEEYRKAELRAARRGKKEW